MGSTCNDHTRLIDESLKEISDLFMPRKSVSIDGMKQFLNFMPIAIIINGALRVFAGGLKIGPLDGEARRSLRKAI